MNATSYRLGLRQESVDKTRARIVAGVRRLLKSREAVTGFSVETAARYAGVTRGTVYHHFTSKAGLLEAVYDSLASRADLCDSIGRAFGERSLAAGIRRLVRAFCRLWATERNVIRRLNALADVAIGFPKSQRNEWRRTAIRELLITFGRRRGPKRSLPPPDVVDVLHVLTSFETYDGLARGRRTERAVATLIAALAVTVALERPTD